MVRSNRIGSYAGFRANRNHVGCRANVNSRGTSRIFPYAGFRANKQHVGCRANSNSE